MAEHANSTLTRRSLLQGLTRLAFIGGSVAVTGSIVRADIAMTRELLDVYDEWLFYERRFLKIERYGPAWQEAEDGVPCTRARFHFPSYPLSWRDAPQPSTRAAIVLSAVGCDWRREA